MKLTEQTKKIKEVNKRIQKAVKRAKEYCMGKQYEAIETCLNNNNKKTNTKKNKTAYHLVKDLTSEKQGGSSTIKVRSR